MAVPFFVCARAGRRKPSSVRTGWRMIGQHASDRIRASACCCWSLVLWDVFQTIVVPRPTPGWFRLGRYVVRGPWRWFVRSAGTDRHAPRPAPRAVRPGDDDPACWSPGSRAHRRLRPDPVRAARPAAAEPPDLGTAIYFAASSVLTLGYGDIVANGTAGPVRGRRGGRERARHRGARRHLPVLAVRLLPAPRDPGRAPAGQGRRLRRRPSSCSRTSPGWTSPTGCPQFFGEWERWTAEVLDSHVAYPLLGYFRSSHDNLSWISALGTVLDTASLVLTTIEASRAVRPS